MPTVQPGQNDYYSRHHRRQSSQSQTSLPDQVKRTQTQTPNLSAVFLPATTYSPAGEPTEPDDFYRPHSRNTSSSTTGFPSFVPEHDKPLPPSSSHNHTRSARAESTNGTAKTWTIENRSLARREPATLPGLKGKPSVKNLIAHIDATSREELPPLPSLPYSTSSSQVGSPVLGPAHLFPATSRNVSNFSAPSQADSTATTSDTLDVSESIYARNYESHNRPGSRPLFGEVFSSSAAVGSPSYDLVNARRRRGSEGSPMHSPNPMFPVDESRNSQMVLSSSVYTPNRDLRADKRRTNSDLPVTLSQIRASKDFQNRTTSPGSSRRPITSSRTPVTPRDGNMLAVNGSHGQQPLTRIMSPGRSNRSASSPSGSSKRSKSPLLSARIIAPPPKISPPLRSSRPRVPVSSASTAASRARMAEKFNAMQKLNNEKKFTQRRPSRPPELTDVDFDARRLKITQALTRSGESEQLRGIYQTGKRWEPPRSRSASPSLRGYDGTENPQSVPSLIVADSHGNERDVFQESSPVDLEHRALATHNALQALQSESHTSNEQRTDSSDFSRSSRSINALHLPLQTGFLKMHDPTEPASAVTDATVETQGTHIDLEPQTEEYQPLSQPSDLFSHVMQMRANSPNGMQSHTPFVPDNISDRGDVMSVNLVMRNTAYLDDDEAVRKGYRTNYIPQEPVREHDENTESQRDSWTSSLHDDQYQESSEIEDEVPDDTSTQHQSPGKHMNDIVIAPEEDGNVEPDRTTMDSDAYTIVNVVLQRYSSTGVVDQQFVDDVYQRLILQAPNIEHNSSREFGQIEQLCLQEIERRSNGGHQTIARSEIEDKESESTSRPNFVAPYYEQAYANKELQPPSMSRPGIISLPSTAHHAHQYKSSLDSAEDWADASPSISDWMRFASEQTSPPAQPHDGEFIATPSSYEQPINRPTEYEHNETNDSSSSNNRTQPFTTTVNDENTEPEEYGTAIIRPPLLSPPLPPKDSMSSIDRTHARSTTPTIDAALQMPQVPDRVTSLAQNRSLAQVSSRPMSTRSRSEVTPWESQDQPTENLSPDARRLKQRRHVLKELVDTEFTYSRDMRVLCDIYKQTAPAALREEDVRLIFGNVEEVQTFARDFFTALKQTARPTYAMDSRTDKRNPSRDNLNGLSHSNTSASTLASATTKPETPDYDLLGDKDTRVGDAFEKSLHNMEVVYLEYIRSRNGANQHLETLQKSAAVAEWLRECKENSSDITNAWNLDALLVKPVQRITKYPLLLKELVDSTAPDHPDLPAIKRALNSVTDINVRINETKKHTELVDQVLSRKRGQSDVRTGLSKAFGRRAEKLKQHVGITDMYEDTEYNELRVAYDNNIVQLMVVTNDCQFYEQGMVQWVNKMVSFAAAAEGWIDVGSTPHQHLESKMRHLAMTVRNVSNIALPDHVDHLHKRVLSPMQKTVEMLNKFKDDPKGLIAKRDKRLVDYAQMKNRKDRGEKVDRKSAERMDQWEALNTEAKERMRRLLKATAHLVQSCQGHLIQIQLSWNKMIQQKLGQVMGISLTRLAPDEIEKDWQVDADFQEASAQSLGLCNGTLIVTANSMMSFLTPGSTLNGEDSPRQPSWTSTNKRSISLNSESSNVVTPDLNPRPSGSFAQPLPESHFDRPYPYPNGRTRAASTTSGKSFQGPNINTKASYNSKHVSASANFARPGTSPGPSQDVFAPPPRLSVEVHSPLMGSFQQKQQTTDRPISSNTFFSASPGPSHVMPSHRSISSSVFSSAMPMSDSPVQDRQSLDNTQGKDPDVLFAAASMYEFNIDRARREAGFPYLTYVTGEIFDIIGAKGELWLARNQDDPQKQVGWIWNKHFCKLAE